MVKKINLAEGRSFLSRRAASIPFRTRHGYVEKDYVGLQSLCGSQKRLAVLHASHQIKLRLQHQPDSFEQQRMIIGEQQPWFHLSSLRTQRHLDRDGCAASGQGLEREVSVDQPRAFLHADQAQSAFVLR